MGTIDNIYRTHLLCPVHHYILSHLHPAHCTLSNYIVPYLLYLYPSILRFRYHRTLSIVLSPLSIELYLELAPGNQHFLNMVTM